MSPVFSHQPGFGRSRTGLLAWLALGVSLACADTKPESTATQPLETQSAAASTPGASAPQATNSAPATAQTPAATSAFSSSVATSLASAPAATTSPVVSSSSAAVSATSLATAAGGAGPLPSAGSSAGMPAVEQGGAGGDGGMAGNPGTPGPANGLSRNPLVSHIFTADPSAEVFEGRVFIYASHDLDDQDGYDMNDYHVFSSIDLVNWQDHGVALDSVPDIAWTDTLYAPDACYSAASDKYYLYFPNAGSAIGVAVSDDPAGPFEDALGSPLIDNTFPGVEDVDWIFDPTCFIDTDGQAYLYFGGGPQDTGANARVVRLGSDMTSIADESAITIDAPAFFEASFMHKYMGRYYFSYSTDFSAGAASIDYMVSDNPMTGFEYAGTILPNPEGNNGDNNHHSIIEYRGSWYIFYHTRVLSNREGLSNYQRNIAVTYLSYDDAGNIQQVSPAGGAVAQLESVYAFERMEAEAMADQRGIEVQFTEEGGSRTGVNLTDIQNADWVGYSQVDFREGPTSFFASVASAAGGIIELHLDGCEEFTGQAGTLIASCEVTDTGGWQSWTELECPLDEPVTGVHDLCLRFSGTGAGDLLNLDHFHFE